jgi:hypothetical protein
MASAKPKTKQEELREKAKKSLLRKLKGRSRSLPFVNDEEKRLFYEIARRTGLKWEDLQRKTKRGQNVFDLQRYRVVIIDVKMLAAGRDD